MKYLKVLSVLILLIGGCGISESENKKESRKEEKNMKMIVIVNEKKFTAVIEETSAAEAFIEMMKKEPVTVKMHDYAGFEKVGSLGRILPSDDAETETVPGDIVLYESSQIVMFYGTNRWAYTRIARIENLAGWKQALGRGDVTAVFTLAE